MARRIERVNEVLRAEISEIVQREMRDPRLDTMLSITEVETSQDMRHAKVHVSVLGSPEQFDAAMKALDAAKPFLHRQLRQRLPDLRLIPDLAFRRDTSMERGARLTTLLNALARERDEAP
jgi:ribosome-binding factor A